MKFPDVQGRTKSLQILAKIIRLKVLVKGPKDRQDPHPHTNKKKNPQKPHT